VLQFAAAARPADRHLVLLSGGAAALCAAPAGDLSLADKDFALRRLMRSGASIAELNVVRKHLSALKGGRLAVALARAAEPPMTNGPGWPTLLTLALSDVAGDDPSVIGSGPTVADPSTYRQACDILQRYDLYDSVSSALRRHLEEGVAGRLIESFGRMVAGDSVVVGATVFAILVVVQFVVITKGASRMAEVAARFALDALPGRQMAIDADLASGAIDARAARRRRAELAREADFFGAMDGASRFVRGDAIAGLVITAVNVVGGMLVGVVQNGWGIAETARAITVLSIGDGLAAQVPAFVIAVAAGLVTARAGRGKSIGEVLPRQVVGGPRTLWMLSAVCS
jgi:flagellar biosynthesis protein FlhA